MTRELLTLILIATICVVIVCVTVITAEERIKQEKKKTFKAEFKYESAMNKVRNLQNVSMGKCLSVIPTRDIAKELCNRRDVESFTINFKDNTAICGGKTE